MIIFGVRSPFVIEIEETLLRLGIEVTAAVSVSGAPRLFDRRRLVDLAEFAPVAGARFLAGAFWPGRRRELVAQGETLGLERAEAMIDPTAILPRSFRAGSGSFINAGVVIGGMSMIGENVFINRATSLGHHTIVGDYVTIGPGATLGGNMQIGEGTVIGAGAVIYPHVRIGAGSVVSAGAVVRKHLPDGMVAFGNPATSKRFVAGRSSLIGGDDE